MPLLSMSKTLKAWSISCLKSGALVGEAVIILMNSLGG